MTILRRPPPRSDHRSVPYKYPLDWARVAEWTRCVVEERLAPIHEFFATCGAQGPELIWNPSAEQIITPQLKFLLEYWANLERAGRFPALRRLDPVEMRPALGYIMLIDPVDGGRDFRYRLYGSTITFVSGFDMTGRLLTEHPSSTYNVEYSLAVYRACLERQEPAHTIHYPIGTSKTRAWHRLILPLADASGAVAHFLVGTVPTDLNGHVVTSF